MKRLWVALGVAFIFASVGFGTKVSAENPTDAKPVVDGPEGRRAFDDLAKAYVNSSGLFDDKAALADLQSSDAATAQRAGTYLLALFSQTLADESNGRTGWKVAPYFNESMYNRARDFRLALAKDFGASAATEAALPAAIWLIENDLVADDAEAGAHVLVRLHSDAANQAIARIISEVHPNQEVLVSTIKEAGTRHLTPCKDGVVALEQSYRKAVREVAVRAAAQLGETNPVPYDPLKAFSPRVVNLLKATLDRILTPVPAEAQWLDGLAQPDWKPGKPYPVHGWLLGRDDKGVTYLDDFGCIQTAAPDKVQFTPGSLAATAKSFAELRATVQTESEQMTAIQASADFQDFKSPKWKEAQARYHQLWNDTDTRLKEMTAGRQYIGPLGGRFLNLPEMTVAAWCSQRGDLASTAAILFPCYDAARDDRWLDWSSRDDLGNTYDLDLLQKFTVERNYPAAATLAAHLGQPAFDGYVYQARSKELAAQIATRSEDFTTLTLPRAADWAKIKAGLDRPGQITWLASRLKLMHCINPGWDEVQFATPYPNDHAPPGAPEVINPWTELINLNLTPSDLLTLAPFAEDEDYSPSYTFYKDWIPERGLCRVSWAVGALINYVAGSDLVHDTEKGFAFEHGDETGFVAELQAWVAAHHDDTREKMIADKLKTSNDWPVLRQTAELALELNLTDALQALADRLEQIPKSTNADLQEGELAELLFRSHIPLVAQARIWVKSPNQYVRFWASLMLVRDGDTKNGEGLDTLQPLLDHTPAWQTPVFVSPSAPLMGWGVNPGSIDLYIQAAETLLASPSSKASAVACGVFQPEYKDALDKGGFQGSDMLKLYFLAGKKECFDFLMAQFDDYAVEPNIHDISGFPYYTSDYAIEFLSQWRDFKQHYAFNKPKADKQKYRAELKTWLQAQFALVQQGKPCAILFPHSMARQKPVPPSARRHTAEEAAGTQD